MQDMRSDIMELDTDQKITSFASKIHKVILLTFARVRHLHNGFFLQALFNKYPQLHHRHYQELMDLNEKAESIELERAAWRTHVEETTNCTIYSDEYNLLCREITTDALKIQATKNTPRKFELDSRGSLLINATDSDILYTQTLFDLVLDRQQMEARMSRQLTTAFTKKLSARQTNSYNKISGKQL